MRSIGSAKIVENMGKQACLLQFGLSIASWVGNGLLQAIEALAMAGLLIAVDCASSNSRRGESDCRKLELRLIC